MAAARRTGFSTFGFVLTAVTLFVQPAAADFVFEFRLTSLTTHRNCFGDDLTIPCETYLSQFCLRRSGETSGCSLGSSGRFGPGGTLPISRQIVSSASWPTSFQLFIRARDEDNPGTDDDLDDIFINRSREPNTGFSQEEEYFGVRRDVSIRLSYRITCQTNYYGSNCATFCVAQNDDVNGRYTCNSDGSIRCRDGYENPGNNCRDRITACSASPCQQDAQCTPIGLTDYSCACPAGFSGKSCEVEINECDINPCQNNGSCTDLINDYSCMCAAGYKGRNCSIDIDDCAGIECRGNSTCVDGVNSFTCVCNLGFEGENCTEINPCDASPCANNGSCIPMGPFNYTCQCLDGYTGSTCELDIDECLTAVCPLNSECVDGINSYTCVCAAGYVAMGNQCSPIVQATTEVEGQQQAARSATMAAVGAVIGILLILSLVIVIVIALLFLVRKGRAKQKSYSLPDELVATTSTFTRSDSHIYQKEEDPKKRSSVAPNPLYHSPERTNGVPDSTDPNYMVVTSHTSSPREHSSTVRTVPNPVYGVQSPTQKSDNIYSLPRPAMSNSKKESSSADEYPYSYARVDATRVSLKSSSGSMIKTDREGLPPAPAPPYEYISMAPAEAAIPENKPITLSPDSAAPGHTKVVYKRSIYDDDFQYEVVNIANSRPVLGTTDSTIDSRQHEQTPPSIHYDVPKASTLSQKEPEDSTPTYGNIPQAPYDRLNRGTDFTQPSSTRLAKIEGSGYEVLNSGN